MISLASSAAHAQGAAHEYTSVSLALVDSLPNAALATVLEGGPLKNLVVFPAPRVTVVAYAAAIRLMSRASQRAGGSGRVFDVKAADTIGITLTKAEEAEIRNRLVLLRAAPRAAVRGLGTVPLLTLRLQLRK